MSPFVVGMKAVCINCELDEEFHDFYGPYPNVGDICTISNVYIDEGQCLMLEFVEYPEKYEDWADGFCADCFRPLVDKGMTTLRELLAPTPLDQDIERFVEECEPKEFSSISADTWRRMYRW